MLNNLINFIETNNIESLLNKVDSIISVKFALYCAESVKGYITDKKLLAKVNVCLELVARYILDPKSVTFKELNAATNAADAASYAAANAASYATYAAAYAAAAANAAAYAAAAAANAAAYAAAAAANAAAKERQKHHLIKLVIEHYRLDSSLIKTLYL